MNEHAAGSRKAIWLRLSLLGVIGASSLLFAPLERLAPVTLEPVAVRLLSMIQPTILVIAFAALGAWAAPETGLDSPSVRAWAAGRPWWPSLKTQFPSALTGGIIIGGLLVLFWRVIGSFEGADRLLQFDMPLVTKVLYGGIVEELLMRWGLMSLLVWVAWHASGSVRPIASWCYWVGLTISAVLFAAGHLPLLYFLVPDPSSSLLTLVFVGNAIPGLLFGWLYWRRGLEAAMVAHGLAHVFGTLGISLLN